MEQFVGNPGLVEIGHRIFSCLDNQSLCQSRLVCKSWRNFITNDGGSRIYWTRILKKNWQNSLTWVQVNKDWKYILQDLYYKHDSGVIRTFVQIYEKYFPVSLMFAGSRASSYGVSPLHQAVYAGDFDSVRFLVPLFRHKSIKSISDGTFQPKGFQTQRIVYQHISFEHFELRLPGDVGPRKYCQDKKDTLLHIAASIGRLDIYQELLKFSYERNPRAEDGRTPLHHACKNGHLNIVEFLMPNLMDKSPRTVQGTTPLHWASHYGKLEVVRYLLSFFDDTNSKSKKGETPLHFATKAENFEVLKLLLEFSKNKNPTSNDGWTLLHMAAKQGNLDIFQHVWNLVEEKFPSNETGSTPVYEGKNPRNDSGYTPLHLACERGHVNIVKFLVSRLKDLNPKDIRERIPLHYAARGGFEKIVKLLLVKSDRKNPNPPDEQDMSPMCYAGHKGHFNVIHLMSEFFLRNCPSEIVIKHFQRASIHSVSSTRIVEYLSDLIQERSPVKQTLMHFACKNGHRNLVKTLMGLNPYLSFPLTKDVAKKDIYGKTPLDYAQEEGHLSLIRILALCMNGNPAKRFKYE